jgi:DNA-binding response OmpR family regulator
MNGKDVFLQMEASIPTIILTAWPTSCLSLQLLELGAVELLTKPVSLDTLQRIIKQYTAP